MDGKTFRKGKHSKAKTKEESKHFIIYFTNFLERGFKEYFFHNFQLIKEFKKNKKVKQELHVYLVETC